MATSSFRPLLASSPIPFGEEESERESLASYRSDSSDSEETLYRGSDITVADFNCKIAKLQSNHGLSDATVKDILAIFSAVLPLPNKCPYYYRYRQATTPLDKPFTVPISEGLCYVLPFQSIIRDILRKNPSSIDIQSRNANFFKDIHLSSFERFTLYFTLNTDGISPIDSRNLQVWPITLSLINLEPIIRNRAGNLVLMSLYVGPKKPQWSEILPYITANLKSGVEIDGQRYKCKIVCLVADMPAKSSICNIQGHNAK